MNIWTTALYGVSAASAVGATGLAVGMCQRHMQYWLPSHLLRREQREPRNSDEPLHVFFAVCDHYEPECYRATNRAARARVARWVNEYPKLFGEFRDANGRPPQHTCFFPADEYRPEYLDHLSELCQAGFADVDVHLHHDNDTPESLQQTLLAFRDTLFHRHGLLRRDPVTGEIVYGFIHGNWALCNSRRDGRWCGVDQELGILLETGCYADFTLPSAPSDTQTRTINSIYYAQDKPGKCKSHDTGIRACVGKLPPEDHLLMVQGPLTLDWKNRKRGLTPRTENADLHAFRPPTLDRFKLWLDVGVHVAGQPNWVFVKLHTHGCKDGNIDMLLGSDMQRFHADLAEWQSSTPNAKLHYVTAWEMAQLVHQAEQGQCEPVIGEAMRSTCGDSSGAPLGNPETEANSAVNRNS